MSDDALRVSAETLLLALRRALERGYSVAAVTDDLLANRDRLSADERQRVRQDIVNRLGASDEPQGIPERDLERWRAVEVAMA